MKTFILLILMIDLQDNEHLDRVNNIKYNDKLSCLVDKSIMSNDSVIANDDHTTKSITYFCVDSLLYKVKWTIQSIHNIPLNWGFFTPT